MDLVNFISLFLGLLVNLLFRHPNPPWSWMDLFLSLRGAERLVGTVSRSP